MNLPDINFWISLAFQSHVHHLSAKAWRAYDELISDERVVFAEELEAIEVAWRNFTQLGTFSTNVWSDAYLAAFAAAADLELVTFDKGFAQFKNLRLTVLS